VIVGAGPCGLACAISLRAAGLDALVVDAACVVSAITQYPTYATFFSTAEKLALGGLPFIVASEKPTRRDALAYYRGVVKHFGLLVRPYERVLRIEGSAGAFVVQTERRGNEQHAIEAQAVVIATGYFGSPNRLGIPGENLPHVSHMYHEGHLAFQLPVVIVGGGNSAAEAALDLWRSGARVTLAHFGPTFDKKIKPWVLPDFTNRVAEGGITVRWDCRAESISAHAIAFRSTHPAAERFELPAEFVWLLTGYAPDVALLEQVGVPIDRFTGIPEHDPATMETSVPGVFVAGVVVAGFDANKVFIENGRYHGEKIVARLLGRAPPVTPGLSRELDS
jgi:thioredoxin reductase (NADPH)